MTVTITPEQAVIIAENAFAYSGYRILSIAKNL